MPRRLSRSFPETWESSQEEANLSREGRPGSLQESGRKFQRGEDVQKSNGVAHVETLLLGFGY